MAYTKSVSYRRGSQSGISSRYRQFLVLVAVIIVGMIVSASINALPSLKTNTVANKKVIQVDSNTR